MPTSPSWRLCLTLLAGLSLFSGCDLLGSGGETTVSGVVVDAETGDPLEGIWVTLRVCGGCVSGDPPVAADSTDEGGRFYLYDPVHRSSYPGLYANRVGYGEDVSYGAVYNPAYHRFYSGVEPGKHHKVRIELQPLDE